MSGLLWTGIDLFMGFVIGPILKHVDLSARSQIIRRLMPRLLFLMPVLSINTGTAGWFMAERLGFLVKSVAVQGAMQVLIINIMARLVTGGA